MHILLHTFSLFFVPHFLFFCSGHGQLVVRVQNQQWFQTESNIVWHTTDEAGKSKSVYIVNQHNCRTTYDVKLSLCSVFFSIIFTTIPSTAVECARYFRWHPPSRKNIIEILSIFCYTMHRDAITMQNLDAIFACMHTQRRRVQTFSPH